MMNKKQKILAILGLGLVLFLIIRGIPSTRAQTTTEQVPAGWEDVFISSPTGPSPHEPPPGESTLSAAYIIAWFIGNTLVRAAAFLADFFLKLNSGILNNPFVINGWQISRDLANLGFVLFIIIIAIATILRYQEYAAKSTLAKLIAVALLVNFSLLGAGVFVNFSNMLTNFFINSVERGGYGQLSTAIASAFNPAQFLKTEGGSKDSMGFFEAVLNPGKLAKALFSWLAGLAFAIIFSLILAFTLFALAIMFLIRFIALNILLVLVPLACLFWILPATKNLWEKWWNNFMRWILFAPAASFFIFLTITMLTANEYKSKMGEYINEAGGVGIASQLEFTTSTIASERGPSSEQRAQLAKHFEDIPTANFTTQITNGIMLIGLILGGLIVANSLGTHGAKTFYGWAQSAGKGARAWAGRKGIQYGTGLLRRKGTEEGAKSLAERTQEWAAARKTGVGRYAAGWVARGTTRLATAGGENQVKYHEKQIADMSVPDSKAALLTAYGPRKIALINKLMNTKQLGNVDMTRIATDDTKKLFARFGQIIPFGNTEKAGLMSVEMNEARVKDDREALSRATEKLMAKFTKKDVEPAAWKDMFSGKAKFGLDEKSLKKMSQYITKAISTKNPALVANILPKLDSTSRINFEKEYRDAIRDASKETRDAFEKTMANYAVGFSPTEAAPPTL